MSQNEGLEGLPGTFPATGAATPKSAAPDEAALPEPYLQLRWGGEPERELGGDFGGADWLCHYELVLPLGKYDIRREIYEDGEQVGERSELVIPINTPTRRNCQRRPCEDLDGTLFADAPFRDGAHAAWDAPRLGGLKVYIIAPDGTKLPAGAR